MSGRRQTAARARQGDLCDRAGGGAGRGARGHGGGATGSHFVRTDVDRPARRLGGGGRGNALRLPFACTGAQFDNGIATEEIYDGTTYRPPQFGDWAEQTGLNAEYVAAQPDLVLVTLGADDVHFVKIVTACVENALEHRFLRFVDLECTRANHGPKAARTTGGAARTRGRTA